MLALALHKGMTKSVVRGLGVPTPDFAVVESAADLDAVDLPYPLFAKPVAEGTGKGITAASKLRTPGELRAVAADLLARFRQPVLVETYLPGREFTVGIAGTGPDAEVLGVMEVLLGDGAEADAYSYFNKENYQGRVSYRLVHDAAAAPLRRAGAARLAGAGLPRRRADGLPPRRRGRGQLHRGQPAGRAEPGPFRPAHHLPARAAFPTWS